MIEKIKEKSITYLKKLHEVSLQILHWLWLHLKSLAKTLEQAARDILSFCCSVVRSVLTGLQERGRWFVEQLKGRQKWQHRQFFFLASVAAVITAVLLLALWVDSRFLPKDTPEASVEQTDTDQADEDLFPPSIFADEVFADEISPDSPTDSPIVNPQPNPSTPTSSQSNLETQKELEELQERERVRAEALEELKKNYNHLGQELNKLRKNEKNREEINKKNQELLNKYEEQLRQLNERLRSSHPVAPNETRP